MQNGIIGDDTGVNLPEAAINENELIEEKRMAEYAKTPEYERIRLWCESRINFHKTCLPDGRPVELATQQERIDAWAGATIVINELTTLMNGYATAVDVVEKSRV